MMMSRQITKSAIIHKKLGVTAILVDVGWCPVATTAIMVVVGDGVVAAIVTPKLKVHQEDGKVAPWVELMMWLHRIVAMANMTIGAVVTRNEDKVIFVPMDVVVDGADVVVVTTDMKAELVDGMHPVMVDTIVVDTEVATVEDEKNFVVVTTEVVITKVIEVVEVATVGEEEVVTNCSNSKLTNAMM